MQKVAVSLIKPEALLGNFTHFPLLCPSYLYEMSSNLPFILFYGYVWECLHYLPQRGFGFPKIRTLANLSIILTIFINRQGREDNNNSIVYFYK